MLKFNCYTPRLFLRMNGVRYGKKLRLIGWPFVFRFPKAKITLGNNVRLNNNFWSNLLGINHKTIIIAKGTAEIKIGDNVGISGASIYAHDSITIGNNCLIGANVNIIDNDFHPIDPAMRLNNDPGVPHAPVVIGENVFIGMNSIILKGTTIGDNCVIGAGSVVHGHFDSNCIIAGNPAKVIKVLE